MKIAIVSSLFPPYSIGGAEQLVSDLALALHRLGHQVDVISTCRRRDLESRRYRTDNWEGIRVWRIAPSNVYWRFDRERRPPSGLIRALWHAVDLWNPSIIRPVREILDRIQPDVVNTHNLDGFSPAVWVAIGSRARYVVHTLHDYHLLCPRATMQRRNGAICEDLCRFCRAYARYNRLFQRHVSALVAPAAAIADYHKRAGWLVPASVVIRSGVDTGGGPQAQVETDVPLRVLFLSRLEREKGCETLLAVMERFRGASGIEFHVAGRGSYEPRLSQAVSRIPNAYWHGFVTGMHKHDLFLESDVYLQLSECRENAPLGLIEAQNYGLYVVGTRAGGIPEQIDSPRTGETVPPAGAPELARVLRELISRRQELRRSRPERIRNDAGYGTREMAEEYVKLFCSLVPPSLRLPG